MQSEKTQVRAGLTRADRVDAVLGWLQPFAASVANEVEFARWISARNADTEQGESWCTPCASAEVERLNDIQPEHEYLVDGGWGSETDCPQYCCKCGKTLTDFLTSYAIRDEVDHYSRHTVSLRGKCSAERAFRFIEILGSDNFDATDSNSWRFFRKVERMCERRRTVAAG